MVRNHSETHPSPSGPRPNIPTSLKIYYGPTRGLKSHITTANLQIARWFRLMSLWNSRWNKSTQFWWTQILHASHKWHIGAVPISIIEFRSPNQQSQLPVKLSKNLLFSNFCQNALNCPTDFQIQIRTCV